MYGSKVANSGSNSLHPDPPEESSPVKRSLSGQLVNGHFIATHSSLEQHPARVVDASLEAEPSSKKRHAVQRRPSAEIAEISLGNHLRKTKSSGFERLHRSRRASREDTFSFHSETSSTSSNSERYGKNLEDCVCPMQLTGTSLTPFTKSSAMFLVSLSRIVFVFSLCE